MVFSSVSFLYFFLPAFLLCYALLPWRNAIALAFSVLFYVWGEGLFVLVLLLSVLINFTAGHAIGSAPPERRRLWLTLGIVANLALLLYFKYFGFLVFDVLGWEALDPARVPHLPLGISFFTFQSLSYLIDVYRRDAKPARSLSDLALYIMMFPQLVAGPIVRYATVARQLRRRVIHASYVRHGLLFFSVGLAQKVLFADNMAAVADAVFALPSERLGTGLAWTGSLAYMQQIYFDFAGYSNMAIGLGLVMGFKFPHNFNYPYISQSITEFWRRWHMSLSSWFRDYLYIPLGGNRHGPLATYRNLFVVFALCGLWHGASWTFLAWGLYHGLLLVVERMGLKAVLARLPRLARHLYALLAVLFGWVLFRAESFEQARLFLARMLWIGQDSGPETPGIAEIVSHQQWAFGVLGILAATPLLRRLSTRILTDRTLAAGRRHGFKPGVTAALLDGSFIVGLLVLCSLYIASGTYSPFIYFRF
ncbi:MBOAT family O-acyltransferase [Thiocystis violacea]|uniref:MBOAT family O-acyltransferase n=1 Tax=Thiocystis violacea TaxID=13725 RepID=UPI001908DC64|nr:MBOAT family protein [Thiocystis violacea]MBK1724318.1 hypothetical protein [Thiocystis violacea]